MRKRVLQLRVFQIGQDLSLDVLTEEAYINIFIESAEFLIGNPLCIFNLSRVLREETIFFRDLKDEILSSLVFLTAGIVSLNTDPCLFLEFAKCTG